MKRSLFNEGKINKVLVLTKERTKSWPESRFSHRKEVFTRLGFGEASSHGGPRVEGQAGSVGGRGKREVREVREVREERSDLRAGLRVWRVAQNRVCYNFQVQASHGTC